MKCTLHIVTNAYRLLAWEMMMLGLLLSGIVARGAEAVVARKLALTAPSRGGLLAFRWSP